MTTGVDGAEAADGGVWMSLWVDDVDLIHQRCVDGDIEVTHPPTDEPWGVREMHVRHPDGHVFRVGRGLNWPDAPTEPIEVERVGLEVRLEARLAGLLLDLADYKEMSVGEVLEETLLHSFEQTNGGVASPHIAATHEHIGTLKEKHGINYDTHAYMRFTEPG